jgi:arsenate reductase (thioredoxin)
MSDHVYNCLFLCTHNSARSILSEGLINHLGKGRFRGYSAGSHASGKVNPFALQLLQDWGIPAEGLHSKTWDDFALPDAPRMDFIITVCDNAAGEVCPVWPGKPTTAHWGVEDPSEFQGSDLEIRGEFKHVALILKRRIELLVSLPPAKLDGMSIQAELKEIGKARE